MTTLRIRSPISSVLARRSRLAFTFFSWPERTCKAYHWGGNSGDGGVSVSEVISVTSDINLFQNGDAGERADDMGQDPVGGGDKTGQENDGNDDHNGRLDQFLVFFKAGLVGIPRPAALVEFNLHFFHELDDADAVAQQEVNEKHRQDAVSDGPEIHGVLLVVFVKARRASDPKPSVLETGTLPIELLPSALDDKKWFQFILTPKPPDPQRPF